MARIDDGRGDVIFASESNRSSLSQAVKRGTLRRIARGIYTRSHDDPAVVVQRNLWAVVAHEVSGAVISDLCGRSHQPVDGRLTVVHSRERPIELPGLVIIPRPGAGPMPGDFELPLGLWGASAERAILENLGGSGPRYMATPDIEAWVVDLASRGNGAERLNDLRDRARRVAPALRRERAAPSLSELVSAVLGTAPAPASASPALAAWSAGAPYDRLRVERFSQLTAHLSELAPEPAPALPEFATRRTLLPFYEAYFSNYIEGTEFTLDEAARIVFESSVPDGRPLDAHDIVGTYRLVSDDRVMRHTPRTATELVELLKVRHAVILEQRPAVLPGQVKRLPNRAGSTRFVEPGLSEATLLAGFDAGAGLLDPFARAVFLMFLVSEVHPFTDGNGRMARLMMNAELVAADEVRIIIPTVYRLNYLSALKGATHNGQFSSLVSVMRFAQRWTARLDLSTRASAERDLQATHALIDANEAEAAGVRLVLPPSTSWS